jgi:Amt family ammonium transporter
MQKDIIALTNSGDVLFMMLGAVMVFAMHGGFAFLEVGTVRKKNQVNALVKILVDFSISTIVYFLSAMRLPMECTFYNPQKHL